MSQTVRLAGQAQRDLAKRLIDSAPPLATVKIEPEKRTIEQSAKMWAMLSDISRAKPLGRKHTAEQWKCLAMHACGWAVQFETGLDGQPFPVGFRTSRMSKAQMSTMIEWLSWFGAEHGVRWSEPMERKA